MTQLTSCGAYIRLAGLRREHGGELPGSLRVERLRRHRLVGVDIFYMTPFLTLPWLYALDKRRWSRF